MVLKWEYKTVYSKVSHWTIYLLSFLISQITSLFSANPTKFHNVHTSKYKYIFSFCLFTQMSCTLLSLLNCILEIFLYITTQRTFIFLKKKLTNYIVSVYPNSLGQSPNDGHLTCFQLFAITNTAAMNAPIKFFHICGGIFVGQSVWSNCWVKV